MPTNKLAARARILYLAIPAFALTLILIISGFIFYSIANDTAQRLARQYSIEAAANFQISVNPHFVLMQQLSRSTTISRWLANEEDTASKALAFEEIMGYALFSPETRIMFTAYESLHAYDFHVGLSFEEFTYWGQLAGGELSQWFYDTRDAEMPFILNIQRERPELVEELIVLFVWSNHRVYYQGNFVGVVTIGFPYDAIFDAVFGNYNVEYRRGYIIDQMGAVRVDSARLLRTTEYGIPTMPALPEAAYDPALYYHIDRHLYNLNFGFLGSRQEETVRLSAGTYRYASITPIMGTEWSVVVLSNHQSVFDEMRYRPLIFAAVAVLLLALLIGNAVVRHVALIPLLKLSESAAVADSSDEVGFYGLDRDDEIGYLAKTINQSHNALKYRGKLLDTINQAAALLLAVEDNESFESALVQSMEMIGLCLGADRVYLLRTTIDAEGVAISLASSWMSERGRQLEQIDLDRKIPFGHLKKLEEILLNGLSFNGPLSSLPLEEKVFLDPYNKLKSAVIFPLIFDGQLWGLFSIDDCVNERSLSNDDMDILRSASLMIGNAYNRVEQAAIKSEREANELNESILSASPFLTNIWDDSYTLVASSQQSVEMFGLDSEEQFIEQFSELSPLYQPCGTLSDVKAIDYIKQAFGEGRAQFEWMHQTLSGEPLPTEITLVRFVSQGRFKIAAYTVDLRPVKAAMKMESEREMNERIRLIYDVAPIMVEYCDENFAIIDCNQTAVDFYGYDSKEEYCSSGAKDTLGGFQPDGLPSLESRDRHLKKAFETGYHAFEFVERKLNGETVYLEVVGIRAVYGDSPVVITYFKDITQVKENERAKEQAEKAFREAHERERKALAEMQRIEIAEESSRAKSRFLARMSHEIRTPISAVLGISEIQLQDTSLSVHMEEAFAKIHNSANLLLGIVNDILDHTKIESGKMTILQEKYDVASIISDVAQLYFVHSSDKDISFNMKVDEGLPTSLIGDALRIEQIINNLLSNAFKYTESGSVELSLQCGYDEENEDNIVFIVSIRDTGLGMTPEQLDELFSEYSRFHEQEVRTIAGTGLGMPIVHSLLQLMGAEIDIESEVGKGTSVFVYIPQTKASSEVLGKEAAMRLQQFDTQVSDKKFNFVPEPMPYGSVLVVDDIEANLYVAKGLLSFYKLNVETCSNGYEAIKKLKQGKVYDLIFMDQMMPGIDGTETMVQLRQIGYTQPIVALTANALVGMAEEFIKAGFDGFISKPIQASHLNAILIKHIKEKQPPELIEEANSNAADLGAIDDYMSRADLQEKLRTDFARRNKNDFLEIKQALGAGDTKTAHRLAHSLKSLAALIKEEPLAQAAQAVESLLAKLEKPSEDHLSTLESELANVLSDIGLIEAVPLHSQKIPDRAKALALFDRLDYLLSSQDAECMQLLDELSMIPETFVLCRQIEDFEFADALKTLVVLRALYETR